MRVYLAVALLCLCYGCASASNAMPGEGVSQSVAEEWGCDWSELQERIQWREQNLPADMVWIPEQGWTVCEVLAAVGVPRDVDKNADDKTYTFWYGGYRGDAEQFKWLTVDEDTKTVQIVSWGQPWKLEIAGAEGFDWGATEAQITARLGEPDSREGSAITYAGSDALESTNVTLMFEVNPAGGLQAVQYSVASISQDGAIRAAEHFRSQLTEEYEGLTWGTCDEACLAQQSEVPQNTILHMSGGNPNEAVVVVAVLDESAGNDGSQYVTHAAVISSEALTE